MSHIVGAHPFDIVFIALKTAGTRSRSRRLCRLLRAVDEAAAADERKKAHIAPENGQTTVP